MEELGRGAEAVVKYDGATVIKERPKKKYRHEQIDTKLRKSRTKREAKVLLRLKEMGFPAPRLVSTDDISILHMTFIKGQKLRDVLENEDYRALGLEIGKKLGQLHNETIIHGDLTTSNMILADQVYFIDFGLSVFSTKPEDMAVDLHLLRQALESKHYKVWNDVFCEVIEGYKSMKSESSAVLNRLEQVESRGRNKSKGA